MRGTILRLKSGSLFKTLLVLTDIFGVWKFLGSFIQVASVSSFSFSFVLGFNNFNNSLWNYINKPLISNVISSFKVTLKVSKVLFSILGDLTRESHATMTSGSPKSTFSSKAGDIIISLTF